MEHSSSRAICSNFSQSASRHWKLRAVFLFASDIPRDLFYREMRSASDPRLLLSPRGAGSRRSALFERRLDAKRDEVAHRGNGLFLGLPAAFHGALPLAFLRAREALRNLLVVGGVAFDLGEVALGAALVVIAERAQTHTRRKFRLGVPVDRIERIDLDLLQFADELTVS